MHWDSGKDLMTSLLRGELTEGDGSGAIYLGGQKVNDWEVLGKEIYYMCPDNYVIEDWTVAEYLCLVDSGWTGLVRRKGALKKQENIWQNWNWILIFPVV